MTDEATPATAPPIEPDEEWLGPPATRWPSVVGLLSLFYAVGGLTCATVFGAYIGFADRIPEMYRGGMQVPAAVKFTTIAQSLAGIVLGVMLLIGAIQTMRRRRSGPPMIRRWVIGRILLGIVSLALFVATSRQQIAMQRSTFDYRNQMMIENDMADRVREVSDEDLTTATFRNAVIFFGISLIVPFFLGFYLSRHRIEEEVRLWE